MKNTPTRPFLAALFIATIAFICVPDALAQTAAPPVAAAPAVVAPAASDALGTIINVGTVILTPLILAGLKLVAPKLPSWLIPLFAPVLGTVIGIVAAWSTGHPSAPLWQLAAAGLAGVGLREVKDQLVPAPNGGWTVAPSP